MSYAFRRTREARDEIIGVAWNTQSSSPTLQQIDVDGSNITKRTTAWYDQHSLFGKIKRCLLTPGAAPVFGTNNRGDGLDLTGAAGHVMTRIPNCYLRAWKEGDYLMYLVSPVEYPTFSLAPSYLRNAGKRADALYLGSYPACFDVATDGTKKLKTKSGEQPMTGSTEIIELPFNSGSVAPTIGELLTGALSGVEGKVVGFYLISGSWAGGDALGKVYLKQGSQVLGFNTGSVAITAGKTVTGASSGATGVVVSITVTSGTWAGGDAAGTMVIKNGNNKVFTTNENIRSNDTPTGAAKATTEGSVVAGFTNPEDINGATGGSNILTTTGAGSALTFDIPTARTWANNVNSRMGLMSCHDYDLVEILRLIETCSLDAQTAIGKGVSELPWTRRFGGKDCGADSINTNVAANGTGVGVGTNGQVSISWRSLVDMWANIWQFVDGFEAVDSQFRIIRRDGLGTFRNPLQSTDYEATLAAPIVDAANDGYGKGLLFEDLTRFLRVINLVGGSSSTYLCDYHYAYRATQTNIQLAGGYWTYGAYCGPSYRYLGSGSSISGRSIGARAAYV